MAKLQNFHKIYYVIMVKASICVQSFHVHVNQMFCFSISFLHLPVWPFYFFFALILDRTIWFTSLYLFPCLTEIWTGSTFAGSQEIFSCLKKLLWPLALRSGYLIDFLVFSCDIKAVLLLGVCSTIPVRESLEIFHSYTCLFSFYS